MLESPLFMQGNTYAARRLRELVGFIFDTEGVVKPETNALKVAARAAGANMSVDVAAGTAAVLGDDQAGQGMYLCPSTAVENLPIGAAPGSNSRIDLVIARLRDAAVTGGTASDWILEVLPGTVAASPVAPAVPASAIPLAQVTVAAGTVSIDAAKISDRRTPATNAAYAAKRNRSARVHRAAALSIPNATITMIPFDAETHDSDGLHDSAVNSTRVLLNQIGRWRVSGCIAYETNTTGVRQALLYRNGVWVNYDSRPPVAGFGTTAIIPPDIVVATAITDFVEIAAYQNSGAGLGVVTGSVQTWLSASYLGEA